MVTRGMSLAGAANSPHNIKDSEEVPQHYQGRVLQVVPRGQENEEIEGRLPSLSEVSELMEAERCRLYEPG